MTNLIIIVLASFILDYFTRYFVEKPNVVFETFEPRFLDAEFELAN